MTTLTKDAIKKSFMKLLNQKPINKITVKEIVEDCGINRNSFYYHFEDIPSLMEEIFNDQVDAFVNRDNVSDNIYDNIMDAIEFSLENKTAMIHIFDSPNHRLFDHGLFNRGLLDCGFFSQRSDAGNQQSHRAQDGEYLFELLRHVYPSFHRPGENCFFGSVFPSLLPESYI